MSQIKKKMVKKKDSKRDTDVRNRLLDFWTPWEKIRVGQCKTTALKHVYYHM